MPWRIKPLEKTGITFWKLLIFFFFRWNKQSGKRFKPSWQLIPRSYFLMHPSREDLDERDSLEFPWEIPNLLQLYQHHLNRPKNSNPIFLSNQNHWSAQNIFEIMKFLFSFQFHKYQLRMLLLVLIDTRENRDQQSRENKLG